MHYKDKPKGKKITISLSDLVNEWAEELCKERGFDNNFSAFVADLIRRERDRQQDRKARIAGRYPKTEQEISTAEEGKKKKPAA